MMKAYPEYKESGVEWLGKFPSNWDIKKLKHIATCNDDVISEKTRSDFEFEYVDIGSVSKESGIEKTEKVTFEAAPSRARRKAQSGDVIISTVRTYLEAIASVSEEQGEYIYSTGFAVVRPRTINANFMQFALKDNAFLHQVMNESTGVSYPAINSNNLMNLTILSPSDVEQAKIASFLQKETSKIDSLISEKECFIKLLQEKRQALISHVVTKGLDNNVKTKPSGVEWIGDIPEHWSAVPLKHIITTRKGVAFKSDDFCDTGIPLVKASDIKNKTILTPKVFLPTSFRDAYPTAILKTHELILTQVSEFTFSQ